MPLTPELERQAQTTVAAALSHLSKHNHEDAFSTIRFFLYDAMDAGLSIPQGLDALLKSALGVALVAAGPDQQLFDRLVLNMAAGAEQ